MSTTLSSDNLLVERLSQGDRHAFEMIYQKYWWPLFNAVHKRVKNREQTEDLVQEVFYKLWRKRADLKIQHLEAYLKTAARYEALNHLARSKISVAFFEPFLNILEERDLPDMQILSKDLLELIHSYAQCLPEKRRQIFLLYFQSMLSTKEIAEALEISQKTVQNQLNAAIKGLKPRIIQFIAGVIASHIS